MADTKYSVSTGVLSSFAAPRSEESRYVVVLASELSSAFCSSVPLEVLVPCIVGMEVAHGAVWVGKPCVMAWKCLALTTLVCTGPGFAYAMKGHLFPSVIIL